ncbi:MAG: hypothetical protein ACK4NX_00205, partial [Candidatus Paceibacteria bacterium]
PKYSPPNRLEFRVEALSPTTKIVLGETALSIRVAQPEVKLIRTQNGKPSLVAQTRFLAAPGQTIEISARPYFFNARDISELSFRWFAGGGEIQGSVARPDILAIRLPNAPTSQGFLLRVENRQNPVESAQINFVVEGK